MADGPHLDPRWWGGEADAPPAAASPERPRRRRVWLAGGFGAAVLAAGVGLALGAGGGGGVPGTALAQAADVTAHVPGYRFTLTIHVAGEGQDVAVDASGELDTRPANGSMSLTVAGRLVNELIVSPFVYVQIPSVSQAWTRVELGAHPSSGAGAGVDVRQTINFLRSVGSVSTAGTAVLDGVPTTHYHALIDVRRLAAGLPLSQSLAGANGLVALSHALGGSGLPLDVWVDAQQRVRELTMSLPIHVGGASLQFSFSMHLFDYGLQPTVSAPAGPVSDLSPALLNG